MKIKIKWKCKPFLNWTSLSKFFPVSFLPFCSFPKHTTWASCLHFVKFPILFWTYWIWLLSVPASWMSLDQVGNSLPIASKQPKLLLFLVTLDFLPPLLPILFSAHLWMNEPKKKSLFISIFVSSACPLNATAQRALSLFIVSSTLLASVYHLPDNGSQTGIFIPDFSSLS